MPIHYAMQLNPTNGDAYVFANRTRTLLKLLHWERGGYAIYYKRLEAGRLSHTIFTRHKAVGFFSFRWDEMVLLMEGISVKAARRKRYNLKETRRTRNKKVSFESTTDAIKSR